ncbi:MAG TPA: GNAT family N-acetyltransferase [Thermoanaerobaculia bacterium]|nr:GNAT family N-acetyltransferase [Thermoanaerobaculia bacterium]
MHIRQAEPSESDALSAIAYASKAHWGYTPAVLDSWRHDLTVSADSIARHPTFVCEVRGERAGLCQLILGEGECSLEHVWVHPSFMGQGVGRSLLAHAVKHAARCGAKHVAIDADPNAEQFYLACGAVRCGAMAAPIEGEPERVRPQLRISVAAA